MSFLLSKPLTVVNVKIHFMLISKLININDYEIGKKNVTKKGGNYFVCRYGKYVYIVFPPRCVNVTGINSIEKIPSAVSLFCQKNGINEETEIEKVIVDNITSSGALSMKKEKETRTNEDEQKEKRGGAVEEGGEKRKNEKIKWRPGKTFDLFLLYAKSNLIEISCFNTNYAQHMFPALYFKKSYLSEEKGKIKTIKLGTILLAKSGKFSIVGVKCLNGIDLLFQEFLAHMEQLLKMSTKEQLYV